jgi:hypothetical protein
MLENFVSMLMLVFAIMTIGLGGFVVYFGSGKSRMAGSILIVVGVIIGILFMWCAGSLPFLDLPLLDFKGCCQEYIVESVLAVIGALIGAGISIGLFLLVIMKS